jgi:uncharacterized repeat protein (TIGR02543 family)
VIGALVLLIAFVQVAAMPTGPFTLNYAADSNGYLTGTTSQSVEIGETGTPVEANPNTGYHFVNWSDGSTQNPRTDGPVYANVNVTASFAIDKLTASYITDGNGTISGTTPQTIDFGMDCTAVEAVPNEGYHFDAWSDGLPINPRTDTNVRESFEVTANFLPDSFTLDYQYGDNGDVHGDIYQTVYYREDGTEVLAVPDEGYHFVDWSDGSLDNPRTDLCIVEDLVVTANFAIDTFTLDYAAGDNGTLSGDVDQIVDIWTDGTAVTAVADEGYLFVDWSDGSTENPRTDRCVYADVDVTANFKVSCTVTFDSRGGSEVASEFVAVGGMVIYPAAPTKSGLYFAGWYKESTCENRWNTHLDLVSGPTTLYAKWTATAPKIAIFGDFWGEEVQAKLLSTGFFSRIDIFPMSGATPTLSLLEQYHAVLVYTCGTSFQNVSAWGDVLADYSDDGFGVVLAMFTLGDPGNNLSLEGRICTDGYLPFVQDPTDSGTDLTLVADEPYHPILDGVASFDGGTSSYHSTVSLTTGATLVAHWSDGCPLVATKKLTAGYVVGLNLFPPSDDSRSDFWDASTDGDFLLANTMAWAASTGTTLEAPIITSDGGGDTASVYANENLTAATTVTATDADSTTLTFSVASTYDGSKFTIDPTTGVLTFKEAPDYEDPTNYFMDNVYDVLVQVSDGTLVDTQLISVTVQDSPYDPPKITSNGGDPEAIIEVLEGQTAVTTVQATDQEGHTLSYRIAGGGDADFFLIDGTTGVLVFKTAPDYETKVDADADGTYDLIVEASNDVYSDSQVIHVRVTTKSASDLLRDLKAYVTDLQTAGTITRSTASGLNRTLDKAIVKIATGDTVGAKKLLNGLITTIQRATPRKIPSTESVELIDRIEAAILKLN